MKKYFLPGEVYGKFTIIKFEYPKKPKDLRNRFYYKCQCICGSETIINEYNLKTGKIKQCMSCRNKLRKKIGPLLKDNSAYSCWTAMKQRCNNPKNKGYKYYGAKGIKLCKEWEDSFDMFLKDMGPRPEKATIGRINNQEGYSPENCRWESYHEQNRNTSRNKFLTINNEKKVLADWAKKYDISKSVVSNRIALGLNPLDALTRKPNQRIVYRKRNNFRGVSLKKSKWAATITINSKTYHIGLFNSEKEASIAYNKIYFEWYGILPWEKKFNSVSS